jgi:hypothetical protein
MKTELEIKEYREKMIEELKNSDSIEDLKFYQGIITGIDFCHK